MKLLRWIAPPILLVLAYVAIVVVAGGIITIQYKGDTGYGGTVIFIAIALLMWPFFPGLYSATLLRDCKHRICYTLYCSFIMGFGLSLAPVIVRGSIPDSESLLISLGLFVWGEIGALSGLIRYSKPE